MNIQYKILYISFLFILSFNYSYGNKSTLDSLKWQCIKSTEQSDHRKTLQISTDLLSLAQKENNEYYQAYAIHYAGVSNILLGNGAIGMQQLEEAEKLAKKIKNDTLLLAIYNGYGIQYANQSSYILAQQFFNKGLMLATQTKDFSKQAKIESNLAEIALILKDTTGIDYAQNCYNWAVAHKNKQLTFLGSYQCANFLLYKKQPTQALEYLKIAEQISQQENYQEKSSLYKLYGQIFLETKQYSKAIEYLNMALAESANAQASTLMEIYVSYSHVLYAQHKYNESIDTINKALKQMKHYNINSYYPYLLKLQSLNYEAIGKTKEALAVYKAYHIAYDSVYNIQKQHSMNELKTIYNIEKHKQNAEFQESLFKEESKKNTYLWATLFFILFSFGIFIYFYYRKNQLYKAIVRQNQEAIKREEQLLNRPQEKPSTLSDEKSEQLFNTICLLMDEQKIYKDCELTRDKLAERLNTNRTYLSQVINDKAGMNYTQFINNYRIQEAVRILSNPQTQEYPLKALYKDLGFNSVSTFYKLFQEQIGMTPSAYKKTITHFLKS